MRARPERRRESAAAGKIGTLLTLFVGLNVASLAYVLITGEYNGDFFSVPIGLGLPALLACFAATTLPFLLLAKMSRRFLRRPPAMRIPVPRRFLGAFVPVLLLLDIYATYMYGVGIIGQPPYEVEGPMKLVILAINRFPPFYIGTMLIVLMPRRIGYDVPIILLLIVVGVMRAGLGAFMYVALVMLLKYHEEVRAFTRRHWVSVAALLAMLPLMVVNLYELRASIRGDTSLEDFPLTTIVTGIFLGRVSSLTNTMVVLENADHFAMAARDLEGAYFQKQAVGGVLGAGFAPKVTPQNLLINMNGGNIENYSYMTGLPGDLLIAGHKSLLLSAANLLTVIALVYATLWFARMLDFADAVPFAFMLMLYPIMSGVASELAAITYFFALMALLFLAVDALRVRPAGRRRAGASPTTAERGMQGG